MKFIDLLSSPISYIDDNTLFLNLLSDKNVSYFISKSTYDVIYIEMNNKTKNLDKLLEILKRELLKSNKEFKISVYCKNLHLFVVNFKDLIENLDYKIRTINNKKIDYKTNIEKFYKNTYEEFLYNPDILQSIKTSIKYPEKYFGRKMSIFDKLNKKNLNYLKLKESLTEKEFIELKSLIYFGVIEIKNSKINVLI